MRNGKELADAPVYSEGRTTSVPVRPRSILSGHLLVLTGNFTVTGGTGVGTMHTDAVYRLVQGVTIIGDGNAIQTWSGQTLGKLDRLLQNIERTQTLATSLAAGASNAFRLELFIPYNMPHSKRPEQFALPTQAVRAPTMQVTWGEASDLAYGTDGALALADTSVEVYEVTQHGGPLNARAYAPLKVYTDTVVVDATRADVRYYLDQLRYGQMDPIKGRDELRAVIVEMFANGASGADYRYNDDVISQVSLNINGESIIDRVDPAIIQNDNKQDYDLSAIESGVFVLDAARDRVTDPGELWTIKDGRPFLLYSQAKQAGDNLLRFTYLATERRVYN